MTSSSGASMSASNGTRSPAAAHDRVRGPTGATMEWTPPADAASSCQVEAAFQRPRSGGIQMEHTTIAVDLAKSVFQVAVSHRAGRVDAERRLSRDRFLAYFAQQPPATVLLEACGSAHYWARQ